MMDFEKGYLPENRRSELDEQSRNKMIGVLQELNALLMCDLTGEILDSKAIDKAHKEGLCKFSTDQIKRPFGNSILAALEAAGLNRKKDPAASPENPKQLRAKIEKWFLDYFTVYRTKPTKAEIQSAIMAKQLPDVQAMEVAIGGSLQKFAINLLTLWQTHRLPKH